LLVGAPILLGAVALGIPGQDERDSGMIPNVVPG